MNIAHLFSGGVDSSVALELLKKSGHTVTAVYLKIWREDEVQNLGECSWEIDLDFVERTCVQLDIPLRVFSLQKEYHERVVAEMIAEIKMGKTPNPDIWCNSRIKFDAAAEKIKREMPEVEKISTGHYAQIQEENGVFFLQSAPDPVKDQSYFLSRLSQNQLSKALFSLGSFQKSEVRDMAKTWNLPAADRPDSQGICFLGKFKFSDFVRSHCGEKPGNIVEKESGKILGEHLGFWFFTIGQRNGLGLSGGPWFVVEKNPKENLIFVSREAPENVGRDSFEISEIHFPSGEISDGEYFLKIRHGPDFLLARVEFFSEKKSARVFLPQKIRGIAEGQSAVLYDAEKRVRGSGIIISAF